MAILVGCYLNLWSLLGDVSRPLVVPMRLDLKSNSSVIGIPLSTVAKQVVAPAQLQFDLHRVEL